MPKLVNDRQELFCQALAEGKTADEAYVFAGYKENRKNASRLKTKEVIRTRIAEIQSRFAAKVEVTVLSLIAEAEEVRVKAIEENQLSAAIAAIKEKGILSGKRVERGELGKPGDFDRLTDDELNDRIARGARKLLGLDPGTGTPGLEGDPRRARGLN
jgi:phage terminase small subunit